MEKYRLIRRRLEAAGTFQFAPGPLAARDDLLLAHDPDYVDRVLNDALSDQELRRIGFPRLPQLITRTLSSVGATVAAANIALQEGWAGVLAGGTHHAHRDFGSGFCVFNDIAVAILRLLASGQVRRAAVIDLDVHQGDGTAAIFAGSPDVFTFSTHGRHNFPFRKHPSTLDVDFETGTTDEEYLAVLASALPKVFAFAPDMVFYQSGVDGLATDRLGKLALTPDGLKRRDEIVFNAISQAGIPCVVTLGGGYSQPIEHTVAAAASTFLSAAQILRATKPTLSRPS